VSRAGRKKKNGAREANGRLRRISAAQRDASLTEKLTVLKQVHRRGDLSQLCESHLGQLVLRHKLPHELFDAGLDYGGLVRHFYHAKGIQIDFSEGHSGSGLGVRPCTARWLEDELERIETPLQKLNRDGFSALKMLCVHERAISREAEPAAIVCLVALGELLRKVGRRAARIEGWRAEA
jgi:hypothetical protein